jgi:hypothetical protein
VSLRWICIFLLLTGCAIRPAFHSESSLGRVVEVSVSDGGPSGRVVNTTVVPVGGMVVPLVMSKQSSSSLHYLYVIQGSAGPKFQTQSTKQFQAGDCVRVWHAPQAEVSTPESNFVHGTMEASRDCR